MGHMGEKHLAKSSVKKSQIIQEIDEKYLNKLHQRNFQTNLSLVSSSIECLPGPLVMSRSRPPMTVRP